jgi:hypothetical protein
MSFNRISSAIPHPVAIPVPKLFQTLAPVHLNICGPQAPSPAARRLLMPLPVAIRVAEVIPIR